MIPVPRSQTRIRRRRRGRGPARPARWCARGKRVMLDRGAERREVHRLGVGRRRRCSAGCPCRPRRVARRGAGQRVHRARRAGSRPSELRRAHVDAREPAPRVAARRSAAPGVDGQRRSADLVHQQRATQRVALPQAPPRCRRSSRSRARNQRPSRCGSRPTGRSPRPGAGHPGPGLRRRNNGVASARIDHHEIIASPMHFHERQAKGCARLLHAGHIRRLIGVGQCLHGLKPWIAATHDSTCRASAS